MIPSDSLKLRIKNPSFLFRENGAVAQLGYEVYHATLGDVISSGAVSQAVNVLRNLESAASVLYTKASSAYAGVVDAHAPIGAIGGLSAFDADLVLDSWEFDEGQMRHPVCGEFAYVGDRKSFVQEVNAILGHCLPPPTWFWAESINPGELRVKCVAVPGADGYAVFGGDTLLGTVNGADWRTLSVVAGTYSVRMCARDGVQPGILSFPIAVTVAGGTMAIMTESGVETKDATTDKPKAFRRFWNWVFFGG